MKNSPSRLFGVLFHLEILSIILLASVLTLLFMHTAKLSAAGRVMLYTGEATIDTQTLVTLELNQHQEDRREAEKLRANISALMSDLSTGSQAKNIKLLDSTGYQTELSRLFMYWQKLDKMIEVCRLSPENSIHVFMLSMEYYDQAKRTMLEVESYSAGLSLKMRREKIAAAVLLLVIAASAIMRRGAKSGRA